MTLAAQKQDLRQLAGAAAFALWLGVYVDANTPEEQALGALLARNAMDVRLAAADLLDALIDGAESVKRLKLDGELEIEFTPVAYADKAARLRRQVSLTAGQAQRYGPPAAGLLSGRGPAPQAFVLGNSQLPSDLQQLGLDAEVLTGREQ